MGLFNDFRRVLFQTADQLASEGKRCEIDDVIRRAMEAHPDAWQSSAADLQWQGARRILKDYYRKLTADEDTAQLSLPGIHLPSQICVRRPGNKPYYVPTAYAVYDELVAGEDERQTNIDAAIRAKRIYTASFDQVRDLMEANREMSLSEAVQLVHEKVDVNN